MLRKRYRMILMTFCMLGTMIFCACGKEAEPLKGTGESGQAQIQEQETPKQTETVEKENVEVKKEMMTLLLK